jgi:hypothetical protein
MRGEPTPETYPGFAQDGWLEDDFGDGQLPRQVIAKIKKYVSRSRSEATPATDSKPGGEKAGQGAGPEDPAPDRLRLLGRFL